MIQTGSRSRAPGFFQAASIAAIVQFSERGNPLQTEYLQICILPRPKACTASFGCQLPAQLQAFQPIRAYVF
jgi:hypothetical protein